MDPQQFQLFLTELGKINSNLQAIQSIMPIKEKDPKKSKAVEEKPSNKEQIRIKEIAKIYSKEFNKKFEDLTKKQEELQKKQETFLKKNGIAVKIESVSRDVLRSLKKVFSDSVGRSLSAQTAPGGKKSGLAGAAGDFLGNLVGGAGIWGVLIAAIAAVGGVAVIFLLLKNLDKIGSFIKDVLPSVGDFLVKVLPPAIESAGKAISTIVLPLLNALVEGVVKLADTILTRLPPVLKSIGDLVLPLIKTIVDGIVNLADTVLKYISPIIKSIGDIIVPIVDKVKEFLMFVIQNIPTIVDTFFGGIAKLTDVIMKNLPPIMPFLTQIAGFIKDIGLSLIDKIPGILNTLKEVFLPLLGSIKEIILALIPPVKDLLASVLDNIGKIAGIIKDILISAFNNLKEILTKLFDALQPILPYVGPAFMGTLDLLKTAVLGIFDAFSKLVNFFRDIALKVLDSVDKIFEAFSNNFKWIITQDPGHILKVAGAVVALGAAMATFGMADAAGNIISGAGSFFTKIVGGKTPVDTIIALADRSDKILTTADNIKILSSTLAEVTKEKYGDSFVEEMKKVSHGLSLVTSVKNFDKIGDLDKLKNLNNLEVKPVEVSQTTAQQQIPEQEENVFKDLYVSTDKLNESILSLKVSLDDIKLRLNDSLKVQQQQAQLTDSSISTLKEIRDKEQSSSNVVVNNSTNSMVFSQKSTSNSDYRKDLVGTIFS